MKREPTGTKEKQALRRQIDEETANEQAWVEHEAFCQDIENGEKFSDLPDSLIYPVDHEELTYDNPYSGVDIAVANYIEDDLLAALSGSAVLN